MNETKNPQMPNGKNKVGAVLDVTVDKMRAMADSSTIIGEPITVGDVTLIPVSKVAYGFASGGSDIATKNSAGGQFAGGGGGGMTVTPVAFLSVAAGGDVKILPVHSEQAPMGAAERIITMAPDLIDQVSGLIKKKKEEPEEDD